MWVAAAASASELDKCRVADTEQDSYKCVI